MRLLSKLALGREQTVLLLIREATSLLICYLPKRVRIHHKRPKICFAVPHNWAGLLLLLLLGAQVAIDA